LRIFVLLVRLTIITTSTTAIPIRISTTMPTHPIILVRVVLFKRHRTRPQPQSGDETHIRHVPVVRSTVTTIPIIPVQTDHVGLTTTVRVLMIKS
jgi:hypothetical protein